MPELIAETGLALSDANSYATIEEADDYFSAHPYYADNWEALGTPEKESFLMLASANLDALISWNGYLVSSAQGMGWPRTDVVDSEGRVIASNIVPSQVKFATFEMAIYMSRGDIYAPSTTAGLSRLKIDVIELEFSGSITVSPVPPPALLALRGLGEYVYGSKVRRVLVG